ncbi:MAG: hypothetical protein U0270_41195 [Labilithrix sp.]
MVRSQLDISNAAWLAADPNFRSGVAAAAEAIRREVKMAVFVQTNDGVVVVVRGGSNGNVG